MTYSEFVTAISSLSVTGVRKKFDAPPSQLSTAALPAMYPRFPEGSGEVVALDGSSGISSFACELAIVVNPGAQDRNDVNYAAAVALMSALDEALRAEAADEDYIDRWSMRLDVEPIGEVMYWVIIARVEASE